MDVLVLGIDVGTQGVRAIVTDMCGAVQATESIPFPALNIARTEHWKEQDPDEWWETAAAVIRKCVTQLKEKGRGADEIAAVSVDATSGTVLALDENNNALTPGIMYNDPRSSAEAEMVREHARALEKQLGYKVNASFGLPKMLWLKGHAEKRASRYAHQQDFIIGRLSGEYGVTDYSNALKTCYDLVEKRWPGFIGELGLGEAGLPRVIAPGEVIGTVQKSAAEKTGLSEKTLVVAGATDGYASALSAGISECGDWASIIGTTMVLKGIEERLITDERGRIYSHLHPQGYWLRAARANRTCGCRSGAISSIRRSRCPNRRMRSWERRFWPRLRRATRRLRRRRKTWCGSAKRFIRRKKRGNMRTVTRGQKRSLKKEDIWHEYL